MWGEKLETQLIWKEDLSSSNCLRKHWLKSIWSSCYHRNWSWFVANLPLVVVVKVVCQQYHGVVLCMVSQLRFEGKKPHQTEAVRFLFIYHYY